MSLLDDRFMTFGGEPIPGKIPPRLLYEGEGELSPETLGEAQRLYNNFKTQQRLSLLQQSTWQGYLPDGGRISIDSRFGLDTVTVELLPKPPEQKPVEAPGEEISTRLMPIVYLMDDEGGIRRVLYRDGQYAGLGDYIEADKAQTILTKQLKNSTLGGAWVKGGAIVTWNGFECGICRNGREVVKWEALAEYTDQDILAAACLQKVTKFAFYDAGNKQLTAIDYSEGSFSVAFTVEMESCQYAAFDAEGILRSIGVVMQDGMSQSRAFADDACTSRGWRSATVDSSVDGGVQVTPRSGNYEDSRLPVPVWIPPTWPDYHGYWLHTWPWNAWSYETPSFTEDSVSSGQGLENIQGPAAIGVEYEKVRTYTSSGSHHAHGPGDDPNKPPDGSKWGTHLIDGGIVQRDFDSPHTGMRCPGHESALLASELAAEAMSYKNDNAATLSDMASQTIAASVGSLSVTDSQYASSQKSTVYVFAIEYADDYRGAYELSCTVSETSTVTASRTYRQLLSRGMADNLVLASVAEGGYDTLGVLSIPVTVNHYLVTPSSYAELGSEKATAIVNPDVIFGDSAEEPAVTHGTGGFGGYSKDIKGGAFASVLAPEGHANFYVTPEGGLIPIEELGNRSLGCVIGWREVTETQPAITGNQEAVND